MTEQHSTRITYTGTRPPASPPAEVAIRHRPLLEVTPVDPDLEHLRELTERPAGLVVFSQNAVDALRTTGAARVLAPLSRHTWWAVGGNTAERLDEAFDVSAHHPENQSFEGLRETLARAELPEQVVAFTLEGTSRDLSPALADRGVRYEQVPIYRTDAARDRDLERLTDSTDWIVLTSSKGVSALLGAGPDRETVLEALEPVRTATIGPKTAATARKHDIRVDFVPEEPDVDALLRALAPPPPDSEEPTR